MRDRDFSRVMLPVVWIGGCFTLASGAYLTWVYHLTALVGGAAADWGSLVAGYAMQAVGAGLFALYLRRGPGVELRLSFAVSCAALVALALPAAVNPSPGWTLAFGLGLNLVCGWLAGYYLFVPATRVEPGRRGLAFGAGYGLATLAGWLISLPGGGRFLASSRVLLLYVLLAAALAALGWRHVLKPGESDARPEGRAPIDLAPSALALACAGVVMISLVKNLGFSFPGADIEAGFPLELSRLFYAVGLVAAGALNDRDRGMGALCTAAALVVPFIMLAVTGEPVSSFICWSLEYLFFGFFTVFRVVLFMDLADRTGKPALSPLGLAFGRLGDAAGTALCLALAPHRLALIGLTAALFFATVPVFVRMWRAMNAPPSDDAPARRSEQEVFEAFSLQHDLSAREREVLRLVLDERSNAEIAEALFVSESTIKYHVHNLLKKTGCKTRMDLARKYAMALYPGLEGKTGNEEPGTRN